MVLVTIDVCGVQLNIFWLEKRINALTMCTLVRVNLSNTLRVLLQG